jgi:hypothetical protein
MDRFVALWRVVDAQAARATGIERSGSGVHRVVLVRAGGIISDLGACGLADRRHRARPEHICFYS